jgi:hypothetical protein
MWWRGIECNGLCIAVVCLLCGIPLGFLGNMALEKFIVDKRPPATFYKVEALNSSVPRGGTLDVRIHRDKHRDDCHVKSERYATDIDGVVFELPDLIWQGGEAGTSFLDYSYDVSNLPVGQYTLHVQLTYFCDHGTRVFPLEQPAVCFRVVGEP